MNLTIRSLDPRLARELVARLGIAGVRAVAWVGPEPDRRGGAPEDAALIDARFDQLEAALQIARDLARRPDRPLAIIGLAPQDAPIGPDRASSFDAVLNLDAPPNLIEGRISAALRAGVTRWEAEIRRTTASHLKLDPVRARAPAGPVSVLCVGAPDPFFLAFEHVLGAGEVQVEATFSPSAAFDRLHEASFDALALNMRADPDLALSLSGALRRNTRLHHTPTLALVPAHAPDLEAAALRRGATQIIRPGADPDLAAGWLLEDVSSRRLWRQNEAALGAIGEGLVSMPTFCAHVDRQASAHHSAQRPFSMAAIRLAPPPGSGPCGPNAWRRAFGEAAGLLTRMVRRSDLCAALDFSIVLMAFPMTLDGGARQAASRAAAVGECTTFLNESGMAGPILFDLATTELLPGETGQALIARTISRLAPTAAFA